MIRAFLRPLLMAETPFNLRLLLLPGAPAPAIPALPVTSARREAGRVLRRREAPVPAISTSSFRRIPISKTPAIQVKGIATHLVGQTLCVGWPNKVWNIDPRPS